MEEHPSRLGLKNGLVAKNRHGGVEEGRWWCRRRAMVVSKKGDGGEKKGSGHQSTHSLSK